MVGAAAVLCPAPEHVEVAPVRVHGAVAGRVGEVGRVLPAGRGRAQVQLAAVFRLLAATQPQPLGGLHMSRGMVTIVTIHLTHHPDVRGVATAIVRDTVPNAGGAVSQHHAAAARI